MRHNQLPAILMFLITPTTTWQFAVCSYTEHKKPQTSRTKTRYTPSTWNQWTPFIPLIYLQIHIAIFPPMVKLVHILVKTNNTPQIHEVLTLETVAFQIF